MQMNPQISLQICGKFGTSKTRPNNPISVKGMPSCENCFQRANTGESLRKKTLWNRFIFIVQQYVSDKNVGSLVKYSQKYLYQISIPHQIPKHSSEEWCGLLLQPPFHRWVSDHCSTLVLQRREKGNESKLPKLIQRINSRKKGEWPRFETLQFTLWHCPLPNYCKNNFCESLYWN